MRVMPGNADFEGAMAATTVSMQRRAALHQRRRQRLQLCDEIGAERIDDLDDRERNAGCDQAVFDRSRAGFIGGEFRPFAFQFHNRILPNSTGNCRQETNALPQSKIE